MDEDDEGMDDEGMDGMDGMEFPDDIDEDMDGEEDAHDEL